MAVAVGACGATRTAATAPPPSSTAGASSTSSTANASRTVAGAGATTTSGSVTTVAATTTTATTGTYTVVGTTPAGRTLTQTSTFVSTTPAGPDGIPLQAGETIGQETNTTVQGQTLDGIGCSRLNQLAYQVSAHLQIYVRGRARVLPGTIGLVGSQPVVTGTTTTNYRPGLCTYWLHTVASNGVIEVRSPTPRTYTLGDLFDLWGEPLTPTRLAEARGRVTATVDGHRWRRSPRSIPVRQHESIQLAVGRPVPRFRPVDWSGADL